MNFFCLAFFLPWSFLFAFFLDKPCLILFWRESEALTFSLEAWEEIFQKSSEKETNSRPLELEINRQGNGG